MEHILRRFLVLSFAFALAACGGSSTDGGNGGGTPVVEECSATTCAGCCMNGVCQPGNTAAACGANGSACSACGNEQICKTDQTCGVDPEGTWTVQPSSASVANTNNGTDWDGDASAPDVYVALSCPEGASWTSTQAVESYEPSWTSGGCTIKAKDLLEKGFDFQLLDEDVTSDDTITQAYKLTPTEDILSAGTLTIGAEDAMSSLTFTFAKN